MFTLNSTVLFSELCIYKKGVFNINRYHPVSSAMFRCKTIRVLYNMYIFFLILHVCRPFVSYATGLIWSNCCYIQILLPCVTYKMKALNETVKRNIEYSKTKHGLVLFLFCQFNFLLIAKTQKSPAVIENDYVTKSVFSIN